jgi:hypothetical protein
MLVWLAQTLYDYPGLARRTQRAQLVTIAYSHYNEYARWCLELTRTPFEEHAFAPGQHALPALSVRVAASGARHLAASSAMAASGKASPTALPLLVCPDGAVRKDSWEVGAGCAALAPIEPALREVLDRELGVAARKLAYCVLLKPQHAARFTAMCTEGRHWAWRAAWHLGAGAALRGMLTKAFRPDDAPALAACVAQLDALLGAEGPLAAALAAARGRGQPFLGGAAPGQADLALASLAALAVLPELYGGRSGTMAPHFAYLLANDEQLRPLVLRWRQTEVGAHVLGLYQKFRVVA